HLSSRGQSIPRTGSWVQTAPLPWLPWAPTHQPSCPARVLAAQILPMLLLGVWGGGLADRLSRRLLIFLSQSGLLVLAFFLAALVAFDHVTPLGLLVVSLLIGVVNAVDTPARLAFVVDMVGRDDLINAVALNSLVFNVARAVGPAVGGVLLDRLGATVCFLVNAVTFVPVLAALLAMRLPRPADLTTRSAGSLLDAFRHLGQ